MFRAVNKLPSVFTQISVNIWTSRIYIKPAVVEMRALEENTTD